jgi:hypothetical protein
LGHVKLKPKYFKVCLDVDLNHGLSGVVIVKQRQIKDLQDAGRNVEMSDLTSSLSVLPGLILSIPQRYRPIQLSSPEHILSDPRRLHPKRRGELQDLRFPEGYFSSRKIRRRGPK